MGHTLDSLRRMYESMRMFKDAPKDTEVYKTYEFWRNTYRHALEDMKAQRI